MDFIFGTLTTSELRLLHHSLLRQGLQHAHTMTPLDPLPDQPVTLTVRAGQKLPVQDMAAYYTTDGSSPSGSRGVATNGQAVSLRCIDQEWDIPAWGYVAHWAGDIPGQPDNTTVRYRISAWMEGGDEYCADWPDFAATVERAAALSSRGKSLADLPFVVAPGGNVFTYHVDHFTTPLWAKNAVIYHIFVDRFYPGDGKKWQQTRDLHKFFGGTLWGVRDKLEYIANLGVDCIWLSPTWVSPTYHGYDIADYYKTAPRLGGDEAMRALIEAAHARGIRVILDLVCNHCSNKHPYFVEALANPQSRYRNWFTFDDSEVGYRSFFGVKNMPKINLENPEAAAWMIDIAQFWLREFDADGYRLDYANGVGSNFWSGFRVACRQVKPDSFIFGEIIEAPSAQRAYVGRLDGLLDFHLEDALRKTYAWGAMTEAEFEQFARLHYAYFPPDFLMPTFLDNHDMDRFLFIAKNDKAALRRAATAQFRLPGPPILYYGTEVGLSQQAGKSEGRGLEESRLPMLWGEEQDANLLHFYRELIQARRRR